MDDFEIGLPELTQDHDNLDRPRYAGDTGFGDPAWARGRFPLSPTATDLRMTAKKTMKPPKRKGAQIGVFNRL